MIDDNEAGRILSELVHVSRTFRVARQRSNDQSFSGTKFGFLQHLRQCDARLGDLAHRLLVSAPVASRAVESLEADGMVERRTDAQDARAFLISITQRGRAKIAESESHAVRRFAESLADWSTADAERAVSILKRLNVHLGEAIQDPGPPGTVRSGTLVPTDNGNEGNK